MKIAICIIISYALAFYALVYEFPTRETAPVIFAILITLPSPLFMIYKKINK